MSDITDAHDAAIEEVCREILRVRLRLESGGYRRHGVHVPNVLGDIVDLYLSASDIERIRVSLVCGFCEGILEPHEKTGREHCRWCRDNPAEVARLRTTEEASCED